jgi:hypothetical protein
MLATKSPTSRSICASYTLAPPNNPDVFGREQEHREMTSERSMWITDVFGKEMIKILQQTPHLRHLTCRPDGRRMLGKFEEDVEFWRVLESFGEFWG